VNLQKAAEIAINDFRSGALGRITLETPEQFVQWWAAGQALEVERHARREKRSAKKKPQRADANTTAGSVDSSDVAGD
jgi:ribosome biogenesis GTPase A